MEIFQASQIKTKKFSFLFLLIPGNWKIQSFFSLSVCISVLQYATWKKAIFHWKCWRHACQSINFYSAFISIWMEEKKLQFFNFVEKTKKKVLQSNSNKNTAKSRSRLAERQQKSKLFENSINWQKLRNSNAGIATFVQRLKSRQVLFIKIIILFAFNHKRRSNK